MEVKLNKSNGQTNIDMYRVATLAALYLYVTGIIISNHYGFWKEDRIVDQLAILPLHSICVKQSFFPITNIDPECSNNKDKNNENRTDSNASPFRLKV